jgi:hypothetical protein
MCLVENHKTLLVDLMQSRILDKNELNSIVFGCKLGEESPMIQFTGYYINIYVHSIELRLFDGEWYQSMAIRLPHTFNQVLVHVKQHVDTNNWHLKISNKSGRYIPY